MSIVKRRRTDEITALIKKISSMKPDDAEDYFKNFLDNGNDINTFVDENDTLSTLFYAVENSLSLLKIALDHGYNGYFDTSGFTILHMSCALKQLGRHFDLLLDFNMNVNVTTLGGETPLHLAAEIGCQHRVKRLIAAGALVNCFDKVDCKTPLDRACEWNHPEIAEILLDAGAKANWQHDENPAALFLLHDVLENRRERRKRAITTALCLRKAYGRDIANYIGKIVWFTRFY